MNTSDEIALRDLCARVRGPNSAAQAAARTRLERLSRQPGALGALEPLITRLAAITGQVRPEFNAPAVLLAAADHGIVAERVSPQPPGSTAQQLHNVLRGGAAINALAASAGARLVAVDAGLASSLPDHPRLRRVAIGPGTRNLAREPAMTRAQAAAALLAGARIVTAEAQAGLDLLLLGDLGAGNTTAAACLTSVFTGVAPELTTGRGAGLDEARLPHNRPGIHLSIDLVNRHASAPLARAKSPEQRRRAAMRWQPGRVDVQGAVRRQSEQRRRQAQRKTRHAGHIWAQRRQGGKRFGRVGAAQLEHRQIARPGALRQAWFANARLQIEQWRMELHNRCWRIGSHPEAGWHKHATYIDTRCEQRVEHNR